MKITCIVMGTYGDARPLVALCKGLKAAGHTVRVATNLPFKDLVISNGLEFAPIHSDPQEILKSQLSRDSVENSSNSLSSVAKLLQAFRPTFLDAGREAYEASIGSDLIICGTIGLLLGPAIAEKLNVPCVLFQVMPIIVPPDDMANIFITVRNLGFLNRFSHRLFDQTIWFFIKKTIQTLRSDILGLVPLSTDYFNSLKTQKHLVLCGYSRHLAPLPSDHDNHFQQIGYCDFPDHNHWQPTPELQRFLAEGKKPFYVGFGSMTIPDEKKWFAEIVKGVSATGQRAVVSSGWGGLSDQEYPPNIFPVDYVPHHWLFPKMKGLVHHAGAGTVHTSLLAGVPIIPVPFFTDHPFYASRIVKYNVGSKPIAVKNFSADRLIEAIQKILNDESYTVNARLIQKKMLQENGVQEGVRAIEQYLQKQKRIPSPVNQNVL